MTKTGLFICSIGLLFIVYNSNPSSGSYNWLNSIMGLTLLGIGIAVFLVGSKREKEQKKRDEEKQVK